MKDIRCVCFDLDDTLTLNIHSVMVLCILNGKLDALMKIEEREATGLDWIEADHQKATLIKGLPVHRVDGEFLSVIEPLKNIKQVMDALHRNHIRCIVVTAGPVQVAEAAGKAWGLDAAYGSEYGTAGGVFTGVIRNHIGDHGKIRCLEEDCKKSGFKPSQCVAVGDGSTDIPLFEYCSHSIAVNYSEATVGKAEHFIRTDDLMDILPYIIGNGVDDNIIP